MADIDELRLFVNEWKLAGYKAEMIEPAGRAMVRSATKGIFYARWVCVERWLDGTYIVGNEGWYRVGTFTHLEEALEEADAMIRKWNE